VALSRLRSTNKGLTFLVYFAVLALGVLCLLYIDGLGKSLMAPAIPGLAPGNQGGPEQINTLLHVLLALAVVIVTARAVGALFKWFGQPPVIGEVIGGILLGPSFLGRLSQATYDFLLPQTAAPFLGIIAQLGVILYMFIVGLELDLRLLRRSGHSTLAISHASIIVPFLMGATLALYLYPELSNSQVPFRSFALFIGISLSITAFPVLARILTDRRVHKTRMGTIALTCAAVDDVSAWCLLAFVVSITHAKLGGAVYTFGLTIAYVAAMFFIGRPVIAKVIPLLEKFDKVTEGGMALVMVALLLSALATEVIGIHAIFGAFLLGAVIPHDSRIAHEMANRLDDLVRVLFLPAFFAFTGMRTQFGLLSTPQEWWMCGAIILVATLGKFGGSFAAARLTGLNWMDAAALGVLMNTRGLVELIVLNIGLDLKVISPTLFAMLVLMALVTTFATTPVLNLITRNRPWVGEEED